MKPRPADDPTEAEDLARAYLAASDGSPWAALVLAMHDALTVQRKTAERSAALQHLISRGYVRGSLSGLDADVAPR